MKITYDAEVDTLVIKLVDREEFKRRFSHDVELDAPGTHAAVAEDGAILSIDIEGASKRYPVGALKEHPATYGEPLSLADAAKHLGTSVQALQKAIARGRLEGKKIGRNWTTTIAALDEYSRSRQHEGPGSAAGDRPVAALAQRTARATAKLKDPKARK